MRKKAEISKDTTLAEMTMKKVGVVNVSFIIKACSQFLKSTDEIPNYDQKHTKSVNKIQSQKTTVLYRYVLKQS